MVDVFGLGLSLAPVKADPEWRLTNLKMIHSERQLANICKDRDSGIIECSIFIFMELFPEYFLCTR